MPHSTSLLRGVAGGLSADTPTEVPLTESPSEVLPMTQEDVPPPPPSYLYVHVHVFRVLFYLRFAEVHSPVHRLPDTDLFQCFVNLAVSIFRCFSSSLVHYACLDVPQLT